MSQWWVTVWEQQMLQEIQDVSTWKLHFAKTLEAFQTPSSNLHLSKNLGIFFQVDLFSKTLLLFPIHLEIHWSLITVTMETKTISYYDSQGIVFRHTTDVSVTEVRWEKRCLSGIRRCQGCSFNGVTFGTDVCFWPWNNVFHIDVNVACPLPSEYYEVPSVWSKREGTSIFPERMEN